jgi:transcriptional regulator with XRE-family HTH domain
MSNHLSIRELRDELGLSLADFAKATGIASKGRMSEIERGTILPPLHVALAIERLSGGRINAATLNDDVKAARAMTNADAPTKQDAAA